MMVREQHAIDVLNATFSEPSGRLRRVNEQGTLLGHDYVSVRQRFRTQYPGRDLDPVRGPGLAVGRLPEPGGQGQDANADCERGPFHVSTIVACPRHSGEAPPPGTSE